MSKSHVIVVREPPPRLEKLSPGTVLTFFREYSFFGIKHGRGGKVDVQMVDCIHGDILAMALQITQGVLPVVEEMPEGSEKDYVRVSLQTPLTPTVSKTPLRKTGTTEEEKKASSGVRLNFEETETKKALRFEESEKKKEEFEGPRPYLYLSDAHVEAMLIHWVGPRSVDAATKFMENITMPSDCTLNDVTAAGEYLMKWKEAMRWCSAHLPHRKTIVTTFIDGIYPKALGESIRKRHFKEIEESTIEFMKKYQDAADAKESLKDIEDELRQEKKKSEDRKTGRERRRKTRRPRRPLRPM